MYLIGRITDENLDTIKVGDEVQIISHPNFNMEHSGFITPPEIATGFSAYSQFPYRGSRTLDQILFRTISERTKRTFTWDFENWRTNLSTSVMKYHDLRYYRSHYWIIKKIRIVDLDEDDSDCI